jgi:inhibitor of cysteine peptidase
MLKIAQPSLALILLLLFALTGCTITLPDLGTIPGTIPPANSLQPATPDSPLSLPEEGDIIQGDAQVDSIEIIVLESSPVQAEVTVRGNLPDGCTTLEPAAVARENNTFKVTLATRREAAAICTQALVPFEQTVLLDLAGLSAGAYVVEASGVSDTFSID